MFGGVPCYNLRALRMEIEHDVPRANGLVGAWREMVGIAEQQKKNKNFEFMVDLPKTANKIGGKVTTRGSNEEDDSGVGGGDGLAESLGGLAPISFKKVQ